MNLLESIGLGDRNGPEASIESTDVGAMLRRADEDAEKTTAIIRLIVFLALAIVLLSAAENTDMLGVTAVVGLYGMSTAAGLLLAWHGIVSRVLPYVFVTADVALVVTQVLLLASYMGMPPSSPFLLPAASLSFVILAYAALRYRPWLVVYTAVLFAVAMELGTLVVSPDQRGGMAEMHSIHGIFGMGMTDFLNFQLLPLTTIALTTFILFVLGRRTRRLLLSSIQHGARAARLSRYFSPNVATRLAAGDPEGLLAGRRQAAAVVFVDIRDFTSIAENMDPDDLSAFLSEYRNRLTEPVFAFGGTVDKFIGDAIMIVFGSPMRSPDDASLALLCCFNILDAATRWSLHRRQTGHADVSVGIGAHYGEVFAGALGSGRLLEFTVIGDTVNVAERLERLSREVDRPLVVSRALLEAAGESVDNADWIRLPPQSLKGHREPVEVFYPAQQPEESTDSNGSLATSRDPN